MLSFTRSLIRFEGTQRINNPKGTSDLLRSPEVAGSWSELMVFLPQMLGKKMSKKKMEAKTLPSDRIMVCTNRRNRSSLHAGAGGKKDGLWLQV